MTESSELATALQSVAETANAVDWDRLATFLTGAVTAVVGALVKGAQDGRSFKRETARREAERARDIAERSQLAALRLATTIEGFGQQAAQWHANFEDEDDPYGGRVSTLPDLAWPTEIGWDALGVASANEAFAFEMDVDQRKQRLASAFEFDGDVGLQLVPDDLLDVSIAAGVLADHIRAAHDIGRPNVVQPSGWDWRHYTQEALTLRAEEKRLRLEQSARRRARRRSTGKE